MVRISILGYGKVGRQLARAFHEAGDIELVQVYNRTAVKESASGTMKFVSDLADLSEADIYIISVSDKAVAELASQLPFHDKLVVHTAGSLAQEALGVRNRNGVFYPLQTFSHRRAVDFNGLPVFVGAQHADDLELLKKATTALHARTFEVDDKQRKALHVAAVFACNFSNHLYKIADETCRESNIPFDVLHPLILETAQKIMVMEPAKAQTGPAVRHDEATIGAHLEFLSDPVKKELYQLITRSIQHA